MPPFRWKNCYADIVAARHDIAIKSFLDDVIRPAIQALETRIAALDKSDDPVAVFIQSDLADILGETKKAFALSVQSIWERQLRAYLRGCAEELRPGEGLESKIEKADWPKLCAIFKELRGIPLEDFPSYGDLDTLNYLGNACRHGDGASATKLSQRCPAWWPVHEPLPGWPSTPPKHTVATMSVPTDTIASFVAAIANFWDDATYIYNESIERKHENLEAKLARERTERAWQPQMAEG
jgi:hypothetical protein